MNDLIIVILISIGIAIGLNVGIIIGKKQKSWSELTEKEKRYRKMSIWVGIIILIFGAIAGLWQFYNW